MWTAFIMLHHPEEKWTQEPDGFEGFIGRLETRSFILIVVCVNNDFQREKVKEKKNARSFCF